jgi:hypothetical protein
VAASAPEPQLTPPCRPFTNIACRARTRNPTHRRTTMKANWCSMALRASGSNVVTSRRLHPTDRPACRYAQHAIQLNSSPPNWPPLLLAAAAPAVAVPVTPALDLAPAQQRQQQQLAYDNDTARRPGTTPDSAGNTNTPVSTTQAETHHRQVSAPGAQHPHCVLMMTLASLTAHQQNAQARLRRHS